MLNDCFHDTLKWIHILGAAYYQSNGYTKEELLNALAYRVEALENDVIHMVSYENPFSWDE